MFWNDSFGNKPNPVVYSIMPSKDLTSPDDLKIGQIWKTGECYLELVDLGKTLVHYRLLKRPDAKVAAVRVASQRDMMGFLARNKATIFNPPVSTT